MMLDIGAYCGTFALRYRDHFDTIYAFEPHPDNFNALGTNLRLSGAANIKPLKAAVSDANNGRDRGSCISSRSTSRELKSTRSVAPRAS